MIAFQCCLVDFFHIHTQSNDDIDPEETFFETDKKATQLN